MKIFSPFLLLLIVLINLVNASPALVEVRFYGFEDPRIDANAAYLSLPKKVTKRFPVEIFEFEVIKEQAIPTNWDRKFTIELIFKKRRNRFLEVFQTNTSWLVRESGNWKKVYSENKNEFEWFIIDCKSMYEDEFDKRLSTKQVFAYQSHEDSLLTVIKDILLNQKIPTSAENRTQQELIERGSNLIHFHLFLYDKYYNFNRIKELILNNFQLLAMDLREQGLSIKLGYSGSIYKPLFQIMEENKRWVCYIGNDLVNVYWLDPMRKFNEIKEKAY